MKKTGTGQIGNSQTPVPFMSVGEEMTFKILWTSPFCPKNSIMSPDSPRIHPKSAGG